MEQIDRRKKNITLGVLLLAMKGGGSRGYARSETPSPKHTGEGGMRYQKNQTWLSAGRTTKGENLVFPTSRFIINSQKGHDLLSNKEGRKIALSAPVPRKGITSQRSESTGRSKNINTQKF